MRIHNDSLLRVVSFARGAGALLVVGSVGMISLTIISAIRHGSDALPWTKLATLAIGGLLPGVALLVSASKLDLGRIRAFYLITLIAVVEVLLGGAAILITMSPLPAVLLVPMLGLTVACGIGWQSAESLRRAKPYAPPKPVASTRVIIPPPPSRKQMAPDTQQPPADSSPAMVIEIRRA